MRRTAVRLAAVALAGTATVLLAAPAASASVAVNASSPGLATSQAPLHAPSWTLPLGRKLS